MSLKTQIKKVAALSKKFDDDTSNHKFTATAKDGYVVVVEGSTRTKRLRIAIAVLEGHNDA